MVKIVDEDEYNAWLAQQDTEKHIQSYEREIDQLHRQIKNYQDSIDKINNDIWGLMYPDDPTGWGYLTQPVTHIKVELDNLRQQLDYANLECDGLRSKLGEARKIIEKLVEVEWIQDYIGFGLECAWCGNPSYPDKLHQNDCPHKIAVAFLEDE